MSKKTKIIIIISIVALVVGVLIYFYNKNKKDKGTAKLGKSDTEAEPAEPAKPNPVIIKKMQQLQQTGGIKVAEMPVRTSAMSTN